MMEEATTEETVSVSLRRRSKTGIGKRSRARIGRRNRKTPLETEKLIIPAKWTNVSVDSSDLRLCKVIHQEGETSPLVVARSLVVSSCQTWRVHIHGHLLDPSVIPSLASIPTTLDITTINLLLSELEKLSTCAGNPDDNFVTLAKSKKGSKFLAANRSVAAYLDDNASVMIDSCEYPVTVRCSKCHLLTADGARCQECMKYRKALFIHQSRADKVSSTQRSTRVNFRYLKTPERLSVLRRASQTLRNRDRRIKRMEKRLNMLTSECGVELEPEVHNELSDVIDKHGAEIAKLSGSDFRKIFWNQQVAALKAKKRTSIRWHPLFVRWCLNISRVSPKAYDMMRESGIELPTRRTLRDYTHWISAKPGFQNQVDDFLLEEAGVEKLEEWQRYVTLIIDEMKIQEDLVYDRSGSQLLGYFNLGEVNNQLVDLEQEVLSDKPHKYIATQMLTLMVRGIFFKLEFPYASFPTQGITAEFLYWIMWEAVRRLEEIGLKVICFVCDGAKPNIKFLKGLGCEEEMKEGVFYKTRNRYRRDRYIYFISDVPHLIKTTRNCWYSSTSGGTRYMWNNGKFILWDHLRYLSEHTQAESGLYIGRKLTYEHLHMISYSKMKVNLAAQVLSNSVSCAFEFLKKEEFMETSKFCRMFDRFFDCMNTRRLSEGREKRKPDLNPYQSDKDPRLTWLEKDFLGYLSDWENSVKKREGFSKEEQNKMTLSLETLKGIRMTVCSFVEMTRYLLTLKTRLFLFSERFTQDPLESFFGQQRARCGSSDNPNVATFLHNAQTIRVQRTLAISHKGNVEKRGSDWIEESEVLSRPLHKRPRRTLYHDKQKS